MQRTAGVHCRNRSLRILSDVISYLARPQWCAACSAITQLWIAETVA